MKGPGILWMLQTAAGFSMAGPMFVVGIEFLRTGRIVGGIGFLALGAFALYLPTYLINRFTGRISRVRGSRTWIRRRLGRTNESDAGTDVDADTGTDAALEDGSDDAGDAPADVDADAMHANARASGRAETETKAETDTKAETEIETETETGSNPLEQLQRYLRR